MTHNTKVSYDNARSRLRDETMCAAQVTINVNGCFVLSRKAIVNNY